MEHKLIEPHPGMKFIDPATASRAQERREHLLSGMNKRITMSCGRTKPHYRTLSPGCRSCMEGTWSCLFINGICNASCFYCPSPQNSKDQPMTNTLVFEKASDYVSYVEKFGFRGVSISGGEPFLTFSRTLEYLRAVRAAFPEMHLWMYSNGKLATTEKLRQLAAAGLNEIRFDISAFNYGLAAVEMASGIIETVTVEIPAIPEDRDLLQNLLLLMAHRGVHHLNLHQIRCTPHNRNNLVARGYTFIRGQSLTVLESEITALEILDYTERQQLPLPVNYCSFPYKNRYQAAAWRKHLAPHILGSYECPTETGYIRALYLHTPVETLEILMTSLSKTDENILYQLNKSRERLYLHPSLIESVPENLPLRVTYYNPVMLQSVSYQNLFREIQLHTGYRLVLEKYPVLEDRELTTDECRYIIRQYHHQESGSNESPQNMQSLAPYECLEEGLAPYL